MKLRFQKLLLKEPGWFFGLAVLLTLLVGAAVIRLDASKARTEVLRGNVERKLELLRNRSQTGQEEQDLERTEAVLADWEDQATRQADRIAAISSAAGKAGVTLTSLREQDTGRTEDGLVASHSHSLRGTGDYRQLGIFLDELYSRPGMVGVEDLEIYRDDTTEPGRVQASMRVTWFAPSVPDASPEEVPR